MRPIDRRRFLRTASLGAGAVALAGILTFCAVGCRQAGRPSRPAAKPPRAPPDAAARASVDSANDVERGPETAGTPKTSGPSNGWPQWRGPDRNDGMLYLFAESGGVVGLARATPDGYEETGRFSVEGKGPSWAHPVVTGGRLYLRYGDNLYAYEVRDRGR